MSSAILDFWADRFAPAVEMSVGGGYAMYRRCLKCGGHAMEGSTSAHVRWCDAKQQQKALTLAAWDALESADRRELVDQKLAVRRAAKDAL